MVVLERGNKDFNYREFKPGGVYRYRGFSCVLGLKLVGTGTGAPMEPVSYDT